MREDLRRSHVVHAVDLLREHHLEIRKHFEGRRITRSDYDISLNRGVFRKAGGVHCVGIDGQGILHGLNQDNLTALCTQVNDSSRVLSGLTRHSAGVIVAAFQASSEVLRAVHDALPATEQNGIHLSLNSRGAFHEVIAVNSRVFTTFYLAVLDRERTSHVRSSSTIR